MASTAAQQYFTENLGFANLAVGSVTSFSCARHLFVVSEMTPSATSEKDARIMMLNSSCWVCKIVRMSTDLSCALFQWDPHCTPPAQSCSNMTTEMNHPGRPSQEDGRRSPVKSVEELDDIGNPRRRHTMHQPNLSTVSNLFRPPPSLLSKLVTRFPLHSRQKRSSKR